MHVIALVDDLDHVCCRYRITPFIGRLAASGITLEPVRRPRGLAGWWAMRHRLKHADAVLLQRFLPDDLVRRWLRSWSGMLIFDFDDAVWRRDSFDPRGPVSARLRRRFARIVRDADLVLAGNPFLFRTAAVCRRSRRGVHRMPTCVVPENLPIAPTDADGWADLVWIGSSSTLRALEASRDLWESLGRAMPGLRLRVIADRFPRFRHLQVEPTPWSAETESRELARGGIGIAWMPEDDWSRGKCGLKLLQYMAAGMPVIANPVGVHHQMVTSGTTGWIAEYPRSWVRGVRMLREAPSAAWAMGQAGRIQVTRGYAVDRWSGHLAQAMKQPGRASPVIQCGPMA